MPKFSRAFLCMLVMLLVAPAHAAEKLRVGKAVAFAGVLHRLEGDERIDFFVQVKQWAGEPVNAEPHKCDELRWTEVGDLPENTIPYVSRAIENFRSGVVFEEFGWD